MIEKILHFSMYPFIWLLKCILRIGVRIVPLIIKELLYRTVHKSELDCLLFSLIQGLDGGVGASLREVYYRRHLASIGGNVVFLPHVYISGVSKVNIGDDVAINFYTMIVAFKNISIGNDVLIGPYVLIHSGNHRYEDVTVPIRSQGHDSAPIVIEDDVWIGAHAIVLKGVTIGRGSVVAAGSIVNSDVAPYSVVAGVPAKKIRDRIDCEFNF